MRIAIFCTLFTAALLLLPGCGRQYPAKGSITYKGKPAASGTIYFEPEDMPKVPKRGAKIRDGEFEIPQREGLAPGRYRVYIVLAANSAPKKSKRVKAPLIDGVLPRVLMPKNNPYQFELTRDVVSGSNVFDFRID